MPKLYGIIIWHKDDNTPMPLCETHNNQAALQNYLTLEEADAQADKFEKENPSMEARVISLD